MCWMWVAPAYLVMASAGRDWLSFQRCDSRVLTRQLDIETSETRRVQLIAKSVKHPANAIGCRRAAGREWLLLPG